MKTIFKLFRKLLFPILLVLAMFFVGVRIMGFRPYVIETQSMEPDYPVNTLVYVHDIEFDKLTVGDVISYTNQANSTVTHRITAINKEDGFVQTKGDANEFEDILPVYSENIIGKVYFKIPYIGKIANQITQYFTERSGSIE